MVWFGDVGAGKSTLAEKLTGLTGLSSDQATSFTSESKIFITFDKRLMFCDTPGINSMTDKFKSNMNVATAINYRRVSRIMLVVKADTRIENMIDTIRRHIEGSDEAGLQKLGSGTTSWVHDEFGLQSYDFYRVITLGLPSGFATMKDLNIGFRVGYLSLS